LRRLGQAAQIDGLQRRRVSITMGLFKGLGIVIHRCSVSV
jgi:hypothetical protein